MNLTDPQFRDEVIEGLLGPPDPRLLGSSAEMLPQVQRGSSTLDHSSDPCLGDVFMLERPEIDVEDDDWGWYIEEDATPPLASDLVLINDSIQACRAQVEDELRKLQSRQALDSAAPRSQGANIRVAVAQAIGRAAQWMETALSDPANGSGNSAFLRKCTDTQNAVWEAARTAFSGQRKDQIKELVRQKVQAQEMSAAQAGAAVALHSAQSILEHPDLEHVVSLSTLSAASTTAYCLEEVGHLLESKPDGEMKAARRSIEKAFNESEPGRVVWAYLSGLFVANQQAR